MEGLIDAQLCRSVFTSNAPVIRGYVRKECGALADRLADDVFQELAIAVDQFAGRFRGTTEEEALAWIYCIARRKKATLLRLNGRDLRAVTFRRVDSSRPGIPDDFLPSSLRTPSSYVRAEEINELLRAACDRLTSTQRAVVELYDFEGIAMPDVARLTGTTLRAAYSARLRAIAALRKDFLKWSSTRNQ